MIAVHRREIHQPARSRVHLLAGLINSDRADFVVEKCTELGVASITFFSAERSQYEIPPAKAGARLARWERLARAALKQSYGPRLPELALTRTLDQALNDRFGSAPSPSLRLLLALPPSTPPEHNAQHTEIADLFSRRASNRPHCSPSLQNLQEMVDSYIIVGPEGGLTGSEESLAGNHGFVPCSISRNVLRAETAAVLACGIVLALLDTSRSLTSPDR